MQGHDRTTWLLSRVVDAIRFPVAAAGPYGRILAANPAWHRLADNTGKPVRDLGDLFPDAVDTAREVLRGGGIVSRRALRLVPDASGDAIWYDLDVMLHPDAPGIVLIVARDVTDHVLARREAEDAREAMEPIDARLRLAQDVAGIGSWEWAADFRQETWSPQQFRLHGLDPARAMPPSYVEWLEMVHPDDRPLIHRLMAGNFDSFGNDRFQMEFRIHRRDTGAERWILSLGRVMERAKDGSSRRLLGVNLDITDRRNEQAAQLQHQALLRLAADAAEVFAWGWEIETGKMTWDDGLEKALGMPPGGFGGTVDAFRALVHPDDALAVEAALQQALTGETPGYRAMFRMIRADGSVRWTATRGTVIRDSHGQAIRIVGMDHDITELKSVEDALRVREAQQAAVAQLGHFILGTSSSRAAMQQAVKVLADTLEVEFTKVLELRPDGESLVMRAGIGWSEDYSIDQATVPAGPDSQAGYTLLRDIGPIIVKDLRTETRFHGPRLLHDHGVVSGMSVVIRGTGAGDRPYGVLGIHTCQDRAFTEQDTWFLESVANLVTTALQRERAEAALLEREARLRLFVSRAPAAIAMFDTEMRYIAVSERYVQTNRLPVQSTDELIGRRHYDVFPTLPAAWYDVHRRVMAGETLSSEDDSFVLTDGQHDFVRWEMTPLRTANGSIDGAVLFTEIITARKAAEAALAASVARSRAIMEAVPHMIFVTSADGGRDHENQHWYDYSGQTPVQSDGKDWIEAVHPDDRDATLAAWQDAVAAGRTYEHEHRLRRWDGSYRWFLSRSVPMLDQQTGQIVEWVGTMTDISNMVSAREAAARTSAALETRVAERTHALAEAAIELQTEIKRRENVQSAVLQSQKLEVLGQLTASVAHDFNNLITAIRGSFQMIHRRTQDPKLQSLVEMGQNAADRASALTRQLLDFGRNATPQPVVLDIEEALRRADEMIAHAVGFRVRRRRDSQPGVWPVLADPDQLEVALLNLAINARDAMPNGGTLTLAARNLTAAERPKTLPPKDYVAVSVTDTGHGMPPHVLARATDPFFTTKPEGKGTGLGLPMVSAFALRSGGCLQIDSGEGKGTSIQIILPRASVSGMEVGEADMNALAEAVAKQPRRILLVNDDEQMRQITTVYLRNLGYTVLAAPNAEAAIVLSHSIDDFDVLVTDVSTSGADGHVLAARLRAERPDLPVLFITDDAGGEALAGEAVLLKPFTGADLVQAISQQLADVQDDGTAA